MTYSVNQPWDQLKVCAVGRSYPPEYYSFVNDQPTRQVLERIAQETEDDYQTLINKLKEFDVSIVRTDLPSTFANDLLSGKRLPPAMTPRDHLAVIGTKVFAPSAVGSKWNAIRGDSWPVNPPMSDSEFLNLPKDILDELNTNFGIDDVYKVHDYDHATLDPVVNLIKSQGNAIIYDKKIDTAMVSRVGKDLYFGTWNLNDNQARIRESMQELFPEYRCHVINTGGHLDGTFCVVKPGLIVSSRELPQSVFDKNFPDWEVFYVDNFSNTNTSKQFLQLKNSSSGAWWVPGEELNQNFINYVDTYVKNWLGYIQETVIDVNMLTVNENNVLCIRENPEMFKVFERHGITPHVVDFRHYLFWDGGLHCVTNDLDRQGDVKDYFPSRSL